MNRGYVLITGGNSGIGLQLAKVFAKNTFPLILIGRNRTLLFKAKAIIRRRYHVPVRLIQCDLTHKKSIDDVYHYVKRNNIQVDILVNNAGFGTYGSFIETDLDKELELIKLNIACVTHMTKLFSKDMAKKGYGKILNISSSSAFQPGPNMAVYFASKAYILHFSEALHIELKRYGITVTALCPGPTHTDFTHIAKGLGKTRIYKSTLSPKKVAVEGYKALMKHQLFEVIGLRNKLLRALLPFISRKTAVVLTQYMLSE